ncbi:anti-phage protein KwaA [Vibrio harveyi]|uniref:anti-phage protein KwaA n=1 Tax=Vibrio harveyi TaxID=669 RepID=UPI00165D3623|nr:anti-phage protein KwaA [Vibrio harveyi]
MSNYQKIKLYFLSLSLLFVVVAIATVALPTEKQISSLGLCIGSECKLSTILSGLWGYFLLLLEVNLLPTAMMLCLLLSWKFKKDFDYLLRGGGQKSIRIRKITNEDYEHLTFLATYIIPFFGITFDDPRRLVACLVLLIIIGAIFVKTDRYYGNPTLALLGFKLYKADLCDRNGIYESVIVISKDNLHEGQEVHFELISKDVFYVKRKKV